MPIEREGSRPLPPRTLRGWPGTLASWAGPWGVLGLGLFVLALLLAMLSLGGGGGSLLGFPVHHDDFRNLSYTALEDLPPLSVRPVSTLLLGLLSIAGPGVYYATLLVLVAAYVALVLHLVHRLFPGTRRWTLVLAGTAAVSAVLFERVPEYALYSGLVTNLVSAVAAAGALAAYEAEPCSRRGRFVAGLLAVALFSASVFAKEDFALAVAVAFALRSLERHLAGERSRRTHDLLLLSALLVIGALFAVWSLGGARPSFLRASGDTYRADLSPASLARTSARYLLCTPGARIATGVQLAVLFLVALRGDRRAVARVAGIVLVTLSLVAPYAALPNHFYSYYAFNWTVWQAASLLALAPLFARASRSGRRLATAGLVVALGGWIAATHSARLSLLLWYRGEAGRNRAIVQSLVRLRDAIRPWPVVGVTGAGPLNPWFGNNGAYFRRRLALTNRWVVFADPDYLERTRILLGSPRMGTIEVREIAALPRADFPVIALSPDGLGTMSLPAGSTPVSLASEVRFVARPIATSRSERTFRIGVLFAEEFEDGDLDAWSAAAP